MPSRHGINIPEKICKERKLDSISTDPWPPIERGDKIYYFAGNEKRGSKGHRKYQANKSAAVLILENAVDQWGRALPGYVAIYQARPKPIRDSTAYLASRPVRRGS